MSEKVLRLIFCHLMGDYIFQTPFIAEIKEQNWYHMFIHCILYCIPFYFCFGLNWKLSGLFFSHLIIDTAKSRFQKISYATDQILHYLPVSRSK